MILYHGTTGKNGESILNMKKIKHKDVKRIYNDDADSLIQQINHKGITTFATTDNYVYLTDSLFNAIYYGNKHEIIYGENQCFYVFKINIDESLLEVDEDEIILTICTYNPNFDPKSVKTIQQSLALTKSVRYGDSVEPIEYMKLPATTNSNPDLLVYEIVQAAVASNSIVNSFETNYDHKLNQHLLERYSWKQI